MLLDASKHTKKSKVKKSPKQVDFTMIDSEMFEKLIKVKKEIGSGATATVYKIKNLLKGEGFLALKMLNKTFFKLMDSDTSKQKSKKDIWNDDDNDDDLEEDKNENDISVEQLKKIFKEWEILSQLDHPNIIKTYGFYNGDHLHQPSIILEYCKLNLEDAIKLLEDFEIVGIIYEICKAMEYLHDMKIIHRDLKTTNILINSQKHVKICDFGIAKFMNITTLTTMSHGVGTFIYMAPELFDIKSKYDEKVDVYAFGVVLYFALTKGDFPPFVQNSPLENTKIPKGINKLSKSLIKNCWSFSSKNRPSFKKIIKIIEDNNFKLIDGIDDKIPLLRSNLELK